MTMEAVAYIRTVRYILNNTVFFAELLYLQTAKALCRRTINCIKPSVLPLKLCHFIVDMLKYL